LYISYSPRALPAYSGQAEPLTTPENVRWYAHWLTEILGATLAGNAPPQVDIFGSVLHDSGDLVARLFPDPPASPPSQLRGATFLCVLNTDYMGDPVRLDELRRIYGYVTSDQGRSDGSSLHVVQEQALKRLPPELEEWKYEGILYGSQGEDPDLAHQEEKRQRVRERLWRIVAGSGARAPLPGRKPHVFIMYNAKDTSLAQTLASMMAQYDYAYSSLYNVSRPNAVLREEIQNSDLVLNVFDMPRVNSAMSVWHMFVKNRPDLTSREKPFDYIRCRAVPPEGFFIGWTADAKFKVTLHDTLHDATTGAGPTPLDDVLRTLRATY
jgi:hypothetical protein